MLYTMYCIIRRHFVQRGRLLVLLPCATCQAPLQLNATLMSAGCQLVVLCVRMVTARFEV